MVEQKFKKGKTFFEKNLDLGCNFKADSEGNKTKAFLNSNNSVIFGR